MKIDGLCHVRCQGPESLLPMVGSGNRVDVKSFGPAPIAVERCDGSHAQPLGMGRDQGILRQQSSSERRARSSEESTTIWAGKERVASEKSNTAIRMAFPQVQPRTGQSAVGAILGTRPAPPPDPHAAPAAGGPAPPTPVVVPAIREAHGKMVFGA